MTNAIYCDRCGELFTADVIKSGKLIGFYSDDLNFDFCFDCLSEIENFCHGGDLNEKDAEEERGVKK